MASASGRHLAKNPSADQMLAVITNLRAYGQHDAVVMGVAYLDFALERVIANRFRPMPDSDYNRLWDPAMNAPLSTFNAKVRLAYAMRLLAKNTYNDMQVIAKVRNRFSHRMVEIDFNDNAIKAQCEKLVCIDEARRRVSKPPMTWTGFQLYTRTVEVFYRCLVDLFFTFGEPVDGVSLDDRVNSFVALWGPH